MRLRQSSPGCAVGLTDVLGTRADELQERLRATKSWARRFDVLDDVLLRSLGPVSVPCQVSWAYRRLVAEAGRVRIAHLATEVGWSRRHFNKQLGAELGVAPKTLARILRFEHACAVIKYQRLPLAQVAAAADYHDQAHMTREWNALAGCTPRVWVTEELPFLQDYELSQERC